MDRRAVSPAVVAQRLCDLLQTFPAAASTGVQWETLVRKYEDVHSSSLDLAALGHSSALAAASSLLWDVLRVVNGEDVDNPVVAVEEGVALTPRPGYLVTWPSLYAACCTAVNSHGTADGPNSEVRGLLLSQLKPLLQNLWHTNFTECGLNYLSEKGSCVRPKKMKHLVTALLRWREEYMETRGGRKHSLGALDKAVEAHLELVPSSKHNDLVLRCSPAAAASLPQQVVVEVAPVQKQQKTLWSDVGLSENDELWEVQRTSPSTTPTAPPSRNASSPASLALEREIFTLRAENAALRGHNERLLLDELFHTSALMPTSEPEIFDDPFEPPPEAQTCKSWGISSAASTATPSGYSSGVPSGAASPISNVSVPSFSFSGQVCTLVPIFIERAQVPDCPSFQHARSFFEKAESAIPSFFTPDARFFAGLGR